MNRLSLLLLLLAVSFAIGFRINFRSFRPFRSFKFPSISKFFKRPFVGVFGGVARDVTVEVAADVAKDKITGSTDLTERFVRDLSNMNRFAKDAAADLDKGFVCL